MQLAYAFCSTGRLNTSNIKQSFTSHATQVILENEQEFSRAENYSCHLSVTDELRSSVVLGFLLLTSKFQWCDW